jgi:hypothetical protein
MGLVPNTEQLSVWDGHKDFWSTERVDLQPYISNGTQPGNQLYVRFTMNSKPTSFFGNTSTGYDGIKVDDILIRYVERSTVTAVGAMAGAPKTPRYYPNPVEHTLLIESETVTPICLYDAMGKMVIRTHPMAGRTAILNTETLPAGVYTLRQGTFVGKVVKH